MGGSLTPVSYGELYTVTFNKESNAENNPPVSIPPSITKFANLQLSEHTAVPDSQYPKFGITDSSEQQWLQEAADESTITNTNYGRSTAESYAQSWRKPE
jgi:hypothetical protein